MRDPPSGRRNHERRAAWTLFEDRASTQVLGFALMFAVTMTTFALYQADVVPDQNEEVEFDHNSAMAGEMGELRAAMQDASTSESAASATLQLSPSYPGRAVAVNPPEPAGRLATSDEHPVYVRGLYSTDERFWDGRSVQYATRHLNYSISYNRITGDEYALEQGMLVKKYANGNTRNLTAAPVNGNRISLTLLGGDYDRTAHRESVEFSPVSTTSRSLTVTAQRTDISGDSSKEDPHIWLPTQLNQDEWTDIADAQDELVSAEVKDSGNSDVPAPAGNGDYVKLTLKDGQQYDFRVSRVTLGQPTSVAPEYLTVSPETLQIPRGGSKPATFTLHDTYGNPVEGAELELWTTRSGRLGGQSASKGNPMTTTTNDGGSVKVFYSRGGGNPGKIRAELAGVADADLEGYQQGSIDIVREDQTAGDGMLIDQNNQLIETDGKFDGLALERGHAVTTDSCLLSLNLLGLTCGGGNTVYLDLRITEPDGDSYRAQVNLFEGVGTSTVENGYVQVNQQNVVGNNVEGALEGWAVKELMDDDDHGVDVFDHHNFATGTMDQLDAFEPGSEVIVNEVRGRATGFTYKRTGYDASYDFGDFDDGGDNNGEDGEVEGGLNDVKVRLTKDGSALDDHDVTLRTVDQSGDPTSHSVTTDDDGVVEFNVPCGSKDEGLNVHFVHDGVERRVELPVDGWDPSLFGGESFTCDGWE